MPNVDPYINKNLPVDYAPVEMLQAAMGKWWLVSLFTLFGGLVGWLIFLVRPPVYEARASLLVTIDFSTAGLLTQFEEDLMMDAVGNLFLSDIVTQRVLKNANQQGLTQVTSEGLTRNGYIERRLGTWELRVRDASPEAAMRIVNIWLEEGYAVLSDAYQHALLANAQARYLNSLENCLQAAVVIETTGYACNGAKLKEIQNEMQQASLALANERIASLGIMAGILLGDPQLAVLPVKPVIGANGLFIIAGAVIGLLLGFVLAQSKYNFLKRG